MYAIIGNYQDTGTQILYKSFNKEFASTFFNNATNKRASIPYRLLQKIELCEVQNKSNADLATESNSGLFKQTGDRLINGLLILETIKKHNF